MIENSCTCLHIGGRQVKPGWHILDTERRSGVDFVGSCVDLSFLPDASVQEVYASHVLEHLGYQEELSKALAEVSRVLVADGRPYMGVPDFGVLCRLYADPKLDANQRFHVMRMAFGAQTDAYDFHKVGLDWETAVVFLKQAGFRRAKRVKSFGLFEDTSDLVYLGQPISLNIIGER